LFYALWPAGKAQSLLFELQDHLAALDYIRHQKKPVPDLRAISPHSTDLHASLGPVSFDAEYNRALPDGPATRTTGSVLSRPARVRRTRCGRSSRQRPATQCEFQQRLLFERAGALQHARCNFPLQVEIKAAAKYHSVAVIGEKSSSVRLPTRLGRENQFGESEMASFFAAQARAQCANFFAT